LDHCAKRDLPLIGCSSDWSAYIPHAAYSTPRPLHMAGRDNDTILGLDVSYEGKPFANDLWILVLSPLVVVFTRITCLELWLAFDEVVCLELADRGRVAYA